LLSWNPFCLNDILVEQWIYLLIAIITPLGASIVGNDDFSRYFLFN